MVVKSTVLKCYFQIVAFVAENVLKIEGKEIF